MSRRIITTKDQDLVIEHVAISVLKPSQYNPRKISDEDFAQLVESIRQYSLIEPLIVNSNPDRYGNLIGGHQRYRAIKQLGYTTVPVVFISLDEEHERALNLRLNRNVGEFDLDLLKSFNIDELLSVGFNDIDLGDVWNASLEVEDDDFDEDKAVEQAAGTDIQPGDMFSLGKHRLICGDATDPAVIKRLVGDLSPSMFYGDPIYNIALDYDKGVSNNASYGGQTKDTKTDAEYADFLGTALANCLAVMSQDAHIFMYCDQTYIGLLQSLMTQHGLTNRRVCLWIKNGFNPVPGVAFNKGYEACVYSTRGAPYLSDTRNLTEILNKEIAPGNRTIDDIKDIFDIWLAKREPGQEYLHPTQKPLTLHEKPLKRCTKIGDVVLDCYGGSGSSLLACEQMKRVALLSEIEPKFCQVILDRYTSLTGQKAVKL